MKRLYDKINNQDNFLLAIEAIKNNKGSKTPGLDGKTIKHVIANLDKWWWVIRTSLENYKPQLVKRVEIPKANGKTRPLGIPTIRDRIIQQMFKQILETFIDPKFHPNSFGFRPNRSAEHALTLQNTLINRGKLYYCIDVDIKGFFDNIDHEKLTKQLWKLGIKDKKVLSIIKRMLKAKIKLPNGYIIIPEKGTPQGGILSPLLANIYLNEFDWWIHRQWDGIKLKHKYSSQSVKVRALKNTNLREVKIVRYADDFKLMCRNFQDAKITMKLATQFLKEKLFLECSPEKTKLINLRRKASEFLGFRIKAIRKRTNKTNWVVKTNMLPKSKKKVKANLKLNLKNIKKCNDFSRIKLIMKYNSQVLGIQNYYKIATHINIDLAKIGFELKKCMFNLFGQGSYKPDERWKRIYKGYSYRTWTIRGITLFTIQACRHRYPMQFSPKNKVKVKTSKELITEESEILFSRIEYSINPNWEKTRAEIYFLQKGICAITGEYIKHNQFDVHHILPKSKGGTDELSNLILIKKEIHKEIHKKNPNAELMKNRKFIEYRNKLNASDLEN